MSSRKATSRRTSLAVTSMTLGALIANRSARAQSMDAEALFAQGNKLMQQGKIAQACEAFEASNRAEPTAGTLIQLGKCLLRSDRIASGWAIYKDALSRVKDPAKRKIAANAVSALESRLSYLTISVSDDNRLEELLITRDGKPLDPTSWNHALPVDGDDYLVVALAPGHQRWQATVHIAVERDRVVVEVPRLEVLPEPAEAMPSPKVSSPALSSKIPESPGPEPRNPLSATRKIAIGVGGASVVGLVTATVLGTAAEGKHANASRLCPGATSSCPQRTEANVLIRAGNRWAFDANVAWGVAGAAALASAVLWLTGASAETTGVRVSVVQPFASGEVGLVVIRSSTW
jgi:hypothetical protein